jgi:hypothetical protein
MASISPTPEISTKPQSPITSTPTPAKKKRAVKRVSIPPPGYKFVKVSRNGEIVTVQRKLSPEELAVQTAATASTSNPGANSNANTTAKDSPAQADTPNIPKSSSSVPASTPQPPTVNAPTPASPSTPALAKNASNPDTITEPQNTPETPDIQAALDEQLTRNRSSRLRKLRVSMVSGLANIVAHTIPSIEIGEFHHGDEIVDHVDDPSDDDLDDDDVDDDIHDQSNEIDKGAKDHGKSIPIFRLFQS